MNPATEAAPCAVHPLEKAVATCGRCGNFMCARCTAEGANGLCPSCVALLGTPFPLSREGWSFSALWDFAWGRFKIDWVMLSVGVLITLGISGAMSLVGQGVAAGAGAIGRDAEWIAIAALVPIQLAEIVINGVMQMGLVQLALDSLNGRKLDVGRIFVGFRYLGRYIVLMLLIFAMVTPVVLVLTAIGVGGFVLERPEHSIGAVGALGIGVASIGLLVASFFLFLPLVFAIPELVANPAARATDVLRTCFLLTRDNRWNIIGVTLAASAVILVGLLACCVGMIPALGLQQLLIVGLYLTLRNGSGAAPLPVNTP